MRVTDAIALAHSEYRRPLELSGYLIVSTHLVCVVDDESTARSGHPHFGILVNRDAIAPLGTINVPLLAGSSVSVVGNISLKGTVTHTGIPALPLYVPYVYEFAFSNDFGSWEFQIGDTFKNVYLQSQSTVSSQAIAALKPLFDPTLTVVQLKRLLESRREHLVGRHLRSEALSTLTAKIEASGLRWRTEESEIDRGVP